MIDCKTIPVSVFARGQALSESLILLGVFSILCIGIQTTVSFQRIAVNTLLDSLKRVFEISLGKSIVSDVDRNFSIPEYMPSIHADVNGLLGELKMAQPGMIQGRSFSTGSKLTQIKILRSSYVDTGYGYASSDRNVQERIASSAQLWGDAFQISSKSIQRVHALTVRVDHAWQRPEISLDFIQPWSGVIPDQSSLTEQAWKN